MVGLVGVEARVRVRARAGSERRSTSKVTSAVQEMFKRCSSQEMCSATSARTHTQRIKPSNRHELFLKFSLSTKGRRSTDPITNVRAKVRTAPGMALDAFKSTFQSIFQPPPPFNTKQDSSPSDRPRKTKLLAFTPLMTITTIYTNKCMDIYCVLFPS